MPRPTQSTPWTRTPQWTLPSKCPIRLTGAWWGTLTGGGTCAGHNGHRDGYCRWLVSHNFINFQHQKPKRKTEHLLKFYRFRFGFGYQKSTVIGFGFGFGYQKSTVSVSVAKNRPVNRVFGFGFGYPVDSYVFEVYFRKRSILGSAFCGIEKNCFYLVDLGIFWLLPRFNGASGLRRGKKRGAPLKRGNVATMIVHTIIVIMIATNF